MSLASYHCSTPGYLLLLRGGGGRGRLGLAATMAAEHARGGKLAELVADHVFRHEALCEPPAVVDQKREADHLRDDRGVAGPSLDWLAVSGVLAFHLGQQALVHMRAFFQGTTHCFSISLPNNCLRAAFFAAALLRPLNAKNIHSDGRRRSMPPEAYKW